MNNNEIQDITPISTNNSITNIQPITQVTNEQNNMQSQISNITPQESNDSFAHGLPDWDLVPPYTTVRRVNRK